MKIILAIIMTKLTGIKLIKCNFVKHKYSEETLSRYVMNYSQGSANLPLGLANLSKPCPSIQNQHHPSSQLMAYQLYRIPEILQG